MKSIVTDIVILLVIAAVCVYCFGESVWNVTKDILVLGGVWLALFVAFGVYFGWALTRAMNPRRKKDEGSSNVGRDEDIPR